jgi:hypothetical protein
MGNSSSSDNFFPFFFIFTARGRVRFETSLRLGNASIFNTNEHGKKRVNIHYAALLEKYVSYLRLSYPTTFLILFLLLTVSFAARTDGERETFSLPVWSCSESVRQKYAKEFPFVI